MYATRTKSGAPRRRLTIVTAWFIAVMLWLGTSQVSAEPDVNDQTVSDAIEDELLFDHAVISNNIEVSTVNGIVTLAGTTDNILEKERAGKIAEMVKGVRSVINLVEVRPRWSRMDKEIKKDAEDALLFNAARAPSPKRWSAGRGKGGTSGREMVLL